MKNELKRSKNKDKEKCITELKCYLALPMESNYTILLNEFRKRARKEEVAQVYVEEKNDVEEAITLEDLFNGIT